MSKRARFLLVFLVIIALFVSGCDDGDGDGDEGLIKMMYNFFLISIFMLITTSCFGRLTSRKKQNSIVLND